MMNENMKAMELRDEELENVVGGANITKEDVEEFCDAVEKIPFFGAFFRLIRKKIMNDPVQFEARR